MYDCNIKIFDNGLKVVAYKMPQMKSVALGLWLATGGRYESVSKRGISHFVEHLLFKGTEKRSATQIKNAIEGIGGVLNGFTSEEVTCYLVKVLGKHLTLGLDILSDMVLNAVFNPKDVERERFVILEEVKMYKDQPDQYVHELLGELMWPRQTLGIPLVGTHRTVTSLTREDLVAYRDRTYTPAHITVVACGDVDWERFVEECAVIFSAAKSGKVRHYKKMNVAQHRPKTNIFHKDTEQTHIAIGFHGISRQHPSRYAMDLLNIVLGANMSSRLFHELREKRGLAYAIGSHVNYYADGGVVSIDAGVDTRKISKAIRLILKELSKIRRRPVTKSEFERAREFYQGHLSFVLEDTVEHMLWLGKKVVTGDKPIDAEEVLQRVRDITIGDILEMAKDIFRPKNLNVAIVGPVRDEDKKAIQQIVQEFK